MNTRKKLFGTDGIRMKAQEFLSEYLAFWIGVSIGLMLRRHFSDPHVVIGRDPRESGPDIERMVVNGLRAVGVHVVVAGVIPTPAVAALVRKLKFALGIVISASHNPFDDNGIKCFGPDGCKLPDELEEEVEKLMEEKPLQFNFEDGSLANLDDAAEIYIEAVIATLGSLRLDGMHVVLDCANGALYDIAPKVFERLGAKVTAIGIEPNGRNINEDVGATHPETMLALVRKLGADAGFGFDGDGDRAMGANKNGIVDGDQFHAAFSTSYGCDIVGTVMSNLGLEQYLTRIGRKLHRAKVGDRHVSEMLQKLGLEVGGEQSGHHIFRFPHIFVSLAPTGDGLLAALLLLALESKRGRKGVFHYFTPVPQVLMNLKYDGLNPLEEQEAEEVIAWAEDLLRYRGRLLVRKSGTERLIRVMVECDDIDLASMIANKIISVLQAILTHSTLSESESVAA